MLTERRRTKTPREVICNIRLYARRYVLPFLSQEADNLEEAMRNPEAYMMVDKDNPLKRQRLYWTLEDGWHPSWKPVPLFAFPPEAAAEIERLQDKALRFDLDQSGIERREADAVELVEARAKIEQLREDAEAGNAWEQQLLGCDRELTLAYEKIERLTGTLALIRSARERGFGLDYVEGCAGAALTKENKP